MKTIYRTKSVSGDTLSYYEDAISAPITVSLIKKELGAAIIKPRYRLYALNPDETIKSEIPEEDIVAGSYNENYQNGQRRGLNITLHNYTGKYTPTINNLWTSDKFGFEIGIVSGFSGETIWFPKGTYILSNISATHEPGVQNVSLELNDKFAILEGKQGTLETSYEIEPGNIIENVVSDLLHRDNGSSEILDPQIPIFHSSFKGKKTQATITKEAGETIGSIILELATQLSAEVFYNAEGRLVFIPIDYVTDDSNKPVIYQLYDIQGDFSNDNLTFSFNDVVNRIIVIGANVDGVVCRATAINDNPASPLCYQRIGYRTGAPINDTNITSAILAQERANYELRQKLILKTTSSINTNFNPLLLVNNIVGITDAFFGLEEEKFLIQGVSYSLDYSGVMSLTVSNVNNLPFAVKGV